MILLARGFSPWNHELLNDTCFAGTYILKNVIENQYAFSAFPYYRLTDWGGLINDKNSLFHGGNGIFARNGIRNPSYFAYSFLRLMKKYIISPVGEVSGHSRSGDGYRAFLQSLPFLRAIRQNVSLDINFINRYQAFPNARSKALTIRHPSFSGAMYGSSHCSNLKFVPFRCQSRFCPTCSAKYSNDRSTAMSFKLIQRTHRHLVFTIDDSLRPFFLKDRSLLNCLFQAVSNVIKA